MVLFQRGKSRASLQFHLFDLTLLTTTPRKVRTRDMGGVSTTHEFTKAILDRMELE